eukprot:15362484-Ditylum_brightwellii.AAC.1
MKISKKSLEFANRNQGNKPLPILFYVAYDAKKLTPLDYQTYKLSTNPKDEKSAVYNLIVRYYEVGTPEEWLQFMDAIMQVIKGQDIQDRDTPYLLEKSLLNGDALQVFKNEEVSQGVKDGPNFTKCLAAVMEHVFPRRRIKPRRKSFGTFINP